MRDRSETIANYLVAAAAVGVLSFLGIREFGARQVSTRQADLAPPTFVEDWRGAFRVGIPLQEGERPVTVVVVSDLECPFCAQYHLRVKPVLEQVFGDSVGTVFVHFPLPGHRFSIQAAQALECAADQNAMTTFLTKVYALQDSIGLKPWSEYARESGVRDTSRFLACVNAAQNERISQGRSFGERIEVTATPTVIVQGWRLVGVPDTATMIATIRSVLAGKAPFAATHQR